MYTKYDQGKQWDYIGHHGHPQGCQLALLSANDVQTSVFAVDEKIAIL